MDVERLRVWLEIRFLRFKSVLRVALGLVGFGVIGYALLHIVGFYLDARAARVWMSPQQFEAGVVASVEGYLLLMGLGIVIVLIASR